MKISISRDDLDPILTRVRRGLTASPVQPVLRCLLLEGRGRTSLEVTGSDGPTFQTRHLVAEVTEPGGVVVQAEHFARLVHGLPAGATIELAHDEQAQKLHITAGDVRASFGAYPVSEYPELPTTAGYRAALSTGALADMLRVSYAAELSGTRAGFWGVWLLLEDDKVVSLSCDGHRAARAEVRAKLGDLALTTPPILVPPSGVKAILSLCGDLPGEVDLTCADGRLGVTAPAGRVVTLLVDHELFETGHLFPRSGIRFVARRAALLDALGRARIFGDLARVDLSAGALRIERESVDTLFRDGVPVQAEAGASFEVTVNVGYVLDALRAIDTDEVEVWMPPTLSDGQPSSWRPFDSRNPTTHQAEAHAIALARN